MLKRNKAVHKPKIAEDEPEDNEDFKSDDVTKDLFLK